MDSCFGKSNDVACFQIRPATRDISCVIDVLAEIAAPVLAGPKRSVIDAAEQHSQQEDAEAVDSNTALHGYSTKRKRRSVQTAISPSRGLIFLPSSADRG